ncbi:hypothetical protein COOONC_14105, partial [Cooperia oncophora]
APENARFFVNADAFYIRCHQKDKQDTESFDKFGGPRKKQSVIKEKPKRYSIDILAFDSTSRLMFMRHVPRTLELMNKLGYEILYGYNKVGDNSMVNLFPILVGDVPEALEEPMNDTSGDINTQWILPREKKLDPSKLPILWKMMQEKFGCRTMLNDDMAHIARGMFHYPDAEFYRGFSSQPTDHYYRAFYNSIYKVCFQQKKNQIQTDFIR